MRLISYCGFVAIMVLLTGNAQAQSPGTSKPNIIYIYADDLGYGELGCYGQQKIRTPFLDQLAAEGIRFTQHYSGAPVCAPARCMLLTGKHSGHSFIRGNYELGGFGDSTEGGQMPLPEGILTLPKLLQQAGYSTAMVGKWGLGMQGSSGSPLLQGFDYYYGYLDQKQAHNYYPTHLWENDRWDTLDNPVIPVHGKVDSTTFTDTDFSSFTGKTYAPEKMTEKALEFIRQHRGKPFFLYLPYTLPHAALQVPEAYRKRYEGLFEERAYYGQQGYVPVKYPLSTYAGMISFLDDQVGRIMALVEELGLAENTLICFSSDNGTTFTAGVDPAFFNSVQGLRGLKMDLYEGGIRVPFIVRWKGHIPGGRVSDLVSAQYDVMSTLAALAQVPFTETDGISLLPELLGDPKAQQHHEYLYFEYPENGGQLAVRMGPWKAVKRAHRKYPDSPWELFRLDTDPGEKNNIASQNPLILEKVRAIVLQAHRHAQIRDWEFLDPKF